MFVHVQYVCVQRGPTEPPSHRRVQGDSGGSLCWIFLFKELLPQSVVAPLQLHQFLVSPSLLNSAAIDHNNLIGPLDGPQLVGDHQQGLVRTTGQSLVNLCRVKDTHIPLSQGHRGAGV